MLSRNEEASLHEVCVFIVLIYSRTWVEAPKACDDAANDRALIDDQVRYNAVNEKISEAALTTFLRHLCYLGADLVGFSLYSRKVSTDEKRDMVTQMRMNKKKDQNGWVPKEGKEISVRLSNLASSESLRFLKSLPIEETILELPPEQ